MPRLCSNIVRNLRNPALRITNVYTPKLLRSYDQQKYLDTPLSKFPRPIRLSCPIKCPLGRGRSSGSVCARLTAASSKRSPSGSHRSSRGETSPCFSRRLSKALGVPRSGPALYGRGQDRTSRTFPPAGYGRGEFVCARAICLH